MPFPFRARAIVLSFVAGWPGLVAAGAGPRPLDRWSLSAGGFHVGSDTTIAARAEGGEYSAEGSFNLEDDLGLDDRQPVAHVRFEMLTTPSQAISLDWFAYTRENEASLARRIVYDGTTFEAAARVRGRIDYDFASAAYRWWFGEGATVWGLGAGLAHYRVATRLEGEASLDGETVQASTSSSDAAFAPMLALGWRHAFSDRWRVYADLSGVAKDGGALSGHVVEGAVGVEWFPARRVGVGLEYGQTDVRLVRDRDDWDARLDLVLRGPTLFLRLR